jgi:hypothetical protein
MLYNSEKFPLLSKVKGIAFSGAFFDRGAAGDGRVGLFARLDLFEIRSLVFFLATIDKYEAERAQ